MWWFRLEKSLIWEMDGIVNKFPGAGRQGFQVALFTYCTANTKCNAMDLESTLILNHKSPIPCIQFHLNGARWSQFKVRIAVRVVDLKSGSQ